VKRIELSDEAYARLKAAADADGVSPLQWIANLLIKKGHLPPGYRMDENPGGQQETEPGSAPH
jgi:hypothetical protein